MSFLLGVVLVAMRLRFSGSFLKALRSVRSGDYAFVAPYFAFAIDDGRHVIKLVVIFVSGLIFSSLGRHIRKQAEAARAREARTERLYAMTRELSSTRTLERLCDVATHHLAAVFEGDVVVLLPDAAGALVRCGMNGDALPEGDTRAASWAFHGERAEGRGGPGGPRALTRFVPLHGSQRCVGVLCVRPRAADCFVDPEQRELLETFAAPVASALERARIAAEAEAARLDAQAARLQSSLLSSISHDIRTPLTVITGAASTLLGPSPPIDPTSRRVLVSAIYDESVRLSRLVGNLLDMTRLAASTLKVDKGCQSLEAVVEVAIRRVEDRLGARPLAVSVPPSLLHVPFDAVLIEQVLINLLENAAKYTPRDTPIEVVLRAEGPRQVVVEVRDRGPGVPDKDKRRIFDKFYRIPGSSAGGAGLGLAICKGIVEAHGGEIEVEGREGGGSVFRFTLPMEPAAPRVGEDEVRSG
jgi:two-component system sensor histidine kinase KdpD